MKDFIRQLSSWNPLYRLSRFLSFRILLPSLLAAGIGWKDFRPMYTQQNALLAIVLVFVLVAGMMYAANRYSSMASEEFTKQLTTTPDGMASMKSLAVTAVGVLFVYTLGLWDVARSFGLLK